MLRFTRAVHHQQIAFVNAGIDHAVASGFDKIGRAGMLHQQLVEVDSLLNIVLSRAGKAALHQVGKKGKGDNLT